jgi:hypothetical protein
MPSNTIDAILQSQILENVQSHLVNVSPHSKQYKALNTPEATKKTLPQYAGFGIPSYTEVFTSVEATRVWAGLADYLIDTLQADLSEDELVYKLKARVEHEDGLVGLQIRLSEMAEQKL